MVATAVVGTAPRPVLRSCQVVFREVRLRWLRRVYRVNGIHDCDRFRIHNVDLMHHFKSKLNVSLGGPNRIDVSLFLAGNTVTFLSGVYGETSTAVKVTWVWIEALAC